jgi:hypothetical protein
MAVNLARNDICVDFIFRFPFDAVDSEITLWESGIKFFYYIILVIPKWKQAVRGRRGPRALTASS